MKADEYNEQIAREKRELSKMVQQGFSFSCEYDITTKRGPWGIFGKKTEHKLEKYTIEEPTLGTLDRLSQEFIMLDTEAPELKGLDLIAKSKVLAAKYSYNVCRIIAIAVLGRKASRLSAYNGGVEQSIIEEKINALAGIFMHCVKPSDLVVIMDKILAISNLVDFISSIMLMSVSRTSKPNMVEGSIKA